MQLLSEQIQQVLIKQYFRNIRKIEKVIIECEEMLPTIKNAAMKEDLISFIDDTVSYVEEAKSIMRVN